jgi:hypothetical protein
MLTNRSPPVTPSRPRRRRHLVFMVLALALLSVLTNVRAAEEQAVIIKAELPGSDTAALFDQLGALEDELAEAVEKAKVGEYDGNELGQGEFILYLYGRDAEKLFDAIRPTLERSPLTRSASVTLRAGAAGAKQRMVKLGKTL